MHFTKLSACDFCLAPFHFHHTVHKIFRIVGDQPRGVRFSRVNCRTDPRPLNHSLSSLSLYYPRCSQNPLSQILLQRVFGSQLGVGKGFQSALYKLVRNGQDAADGDAVMNRKNRKLETARCNENNGCQLSFHVVFIGVCRLSFVACRLSLVACRFVWYR